MKYEFVLVSSTSAINFVFSGDV